jgi:hypothetical protein
LVLFCLPDFFFRFGGRRRFFFFPHSPAPPPPPQQQLTPKNKNKTDEATSALDVNTERALQRHIRGGAGAGEGDEEGGRGGYAATALVVAHRLSTISDADRIVVLHEGKVAEMGTHDELTSNENGMYAEMWRKQVTSGGAGGGGGGEAGAAAAGPAAPAVTAAAPAPRNPHHHHGHGR